MPKLKSNRAAKKRFKRTKSGKFKRKRASLRHLLSSKSRKRKRHLRRSGLVASADQAAVRQLLPYG